MMFGVFYMYTVNTKKQYGFETVCDHINIAVYGNKDGKYKWVVIID